MIELGILYCGIGSVALATGGLIAVIMRYAHSE